MDENIPVAIWALTTALACLLILKITGKYKAAAVFVGIAGTLINQYDLFFVMTSSRLVTMFWITAVALYVFYLLGAKWGIGTFAVNIFGVALSTYFMDTDRLAEVISDRNLSDTISIMVNLLTVLFVISYLMNKIIQAATKAERLSIQAQQELRKQYTVVKTQNKEKTVMLKEIHHRVKNNLQVITSLLRLQQKEIKDPKVIEHFDDAIQRVLSMALIHERMYQSKDLSKIDLEEYLRTLSQELIDSYNIQKPIELNVRCELEYIQPKSLVSFALMFNELISNTLKHAFTDEDKGEISIEITHPKKGMIECIYRDSGTWKPIKREGSFGTELIEVLCEELDGEYERIIKNGTTYKFKFEYSNLE